MTIETREARIEARIRMLDFRLDSSESRRILRRMQSRGDFLYELRQAAFDTLATHFSITLRSRFGLERRR